jgi:diadenosine tetraphosphate (Ap4A) HIT family hydrolase
MICDFCNMLGASEPAFAETMHFVSLIDVHPISPGHMLLVPRRHVSSITKLKLAEWTDLKKILKVFGRPYTWPPKARWQSIYQTLRERKLCENSVWFIDKALAHPRFGEKPDGFFHFVNEGEAAGQTVPHLHWHIVPRYIGDVDDPTGGGRNAIPGMGNYKTPRP